MSRKSTATKVCDITRYTGEVALFELSKQVKKGAISTKFVVVARFKPRSGSINTTVWLSNEKGDVIFIEPIKEFRSKDITDALDQFGYKLI